DAERAARGQVSQLVFALSAAHRPPGDSEFPGPAGSQGRFPRRARFLPRDRVVGPEPRRSGQSPAGRLQKAPTVSGGPEAGPVPSVTGPVRRRDGITAMLAGRADQALGYHLRARAAPPLATGVLARGISPTGSKGGTGQARDRDSAT